MSLQITILKVLAGTLKGAHRLRTSRVMLGFSYPAVRIGSNG